MISRDKYVDEIYCKISKTKGKPTWDESEVKFNISTAYTLVNNYPCVNQPANKFQTVCPKTPGYSSSLNFPRRILVSNIIFRNSFSCHKELYYRAGWPSKDKIDELFSRHSSCSIIHKKDYQVYSQWASRVYW